MTRRSRRSAFENRGPESREVMRAGKSVRREVRRAIGEVGTVLGVSGVNGGVLDFPICRRINQPYPSTNACVERTFFPFDGLISL
jgi:hypothetical protein